MLNKNNPTLIAKSLNKILQKNWHFGSLTMELPNGIKWHYQGKEIGPHATIKINNYKAFNRILAAADIGFFEAYFDNQWETDNLDNLLFLFSKNLDHLSQAIFRNTFSQKINYFLHLLNSNSKKGSKKNIFAHYDLGNEFYSQWLDESMTYSAAVFEETDNIKEAQNAKYASLAKMVDLKEGQEVLEIGCGWGGFAEYAAKNIGANVTCITISPAQYEFALKRIKDKGLSDKVKILLMDYRDLNGKFDAIVSIEMFEAVGLQYWKTYFEKIKACLKKNGKAALQIITIRDDLFEDYSVRSDFIQKYVFPGGMLPSIEKLEIATKSINLKMTTQRVFGFDYSKTIEHWAQNFNKAWHEGNIKGFDIGFKKLWDFYLSYCKAGFDTQRTNVIHLTLEKAE